MIIASAPAVIAELCGARALRKLSLRQIAPTVALGALPPEETLRLLRRSGHAPVAVSSDGTVKAESAPCRRLPVEAADRHDLRHTFAYQLSQASGHNHAELERRLGHSSDRYLRIYTNPPDDIAAAYVEDF
ncbi:tyrosine-type recombinase/integrase [Streptosporangium sp. NPDC000396]|uniref:tyrosine-type recombinase/integrase n=1 Tax=Streptosporangium sp. NPDC000396 TaxID=3366185 RepID=UPI0036C4266D